MGLFTLECEHVFLCILYHPFGLIGSVLKLKNSRKKGLIFYPPKTGILAMKSYVDGEHVHVATMYFRQFSQNCKLSS